MSAPFSFALAGHRFAVALEGDDVTITRDGAPYAVARLEDDELVDSTPALSDFEAVAFALAIARLQDGDAGALPSPGIALALGLERPKAPAPVIDLAAERERRASRTLPAA